MNTILLQGKVYQEHRLQCPDCQGAMLLSLHLNHILYRCIRAGCGATHSALADGSPSGYPANAVTRQARSQIHKGFAKLLDGGVWTEQALHRWACGALGMQAWVGVSNMDLAQCQQLLQCLSEDFGITDLLGNKNDFVELRF